MTRIHYIEWGDPDNPRVLVCVHGLLRNGRDFDVLAQAMQDTYRVVCPDLPGRGRSDWLADPAEYGYPLYLHDLVVLLGRLHVERVDWLGTSLGGLIGMMVAALPNNPIRRLVMNDVGPYVPQAALARIRAYAGAAPRFKDLGTLERYLREIYAPFGLLTDEQWSHLAGHSARRTASGEYALNYDPAIGVSLQEQPLEAIDLWQLWEAIHYPVQVLRGAASDVLLAETAARMRQRGPRADIVEFAGIGHAPALMVPDQIAAVRNWLLAG